MGELDAFREEGAEQPRYQAPSIVVQLLVFSLGDRLLGIRAEHVDSIIPWIDPSPLPMASDRVLGVAQDRGRLVVIFAQEPRSAVPARLVLCASSRGLIGVGASTTHAIGAVTFRSDLAIGRPVDTDAGVLTVLDPEVLAASVSES